MTSFVFENSYEDSSITKKVKSIHVDDTTFTCLESLRIVGHKPQVLHVKGVVSSHLISMDLGRINKLVLGSEFSETKNLKQGLIFSVKELVFDSAEFYAEDLSLDVKKIVFKQDLVFKNLKLLRLENWEGETMEEFNAPLISSIAFWQCKNIDIDRVRARFPDARIRVLSVR